MKSTVLVTATYPPEKVTEVGKKYLEVARTIPKSIKRLGQSPYVTMAEEGIKTICLYEIKDEELADGIRKIIEYYTKYIEITGYRWKLDIVMGTMEALPLIGIKPPE